MTDDQQPAGSTEPTGDQRPAGMPSFEPSAGDLPAAGPYGAPAGRPDPRTWSVASPPSTFQPAGAAAGSVPAAAGGVARPSYWRRGDTDARPPSTLASLLGFIGGALALFSLFELLDKVYPAQRRSGALVLALLFEALGVLVMFLWRDRGAAAAGVVVSAVTVIPVLVFVFVDTKHPNVTFGSIDRSKGTITAILLVGALLWLAAYAFAPVRRAGVFLVAAAVSLWLVFLVQIATAGLDRASTLPGRFTTSSSTFTTPTFAPDGSLTSPSTSSHTISPLTRIGVISLLFGAVYLLLAVRSDRRGDERTGSSLFGVAIPIITIGVLSLRPSLHTKGTAVLALVLAGVAVVAGTSTGRRFTSWYGSVAAVVAASTLVADITGRNRIAAALVLLALGIAATALGLALDASPLLGASPEPPPGSPPLGGAPSTPVGPAPAPSPSWAPPGRFPSAGPSVPPPPGAQSNMPAEPSDPAPWVPPPALPRDPAPWAPPPDAPDAPGAGPANPTPGFSRPGNLAPRPPDPPPEPPPGSGA